MKVTLIDRSESELIGTIGNQDILIVPIEISTYTYRTNLYVPPLVSLMMAKNDEFCKLIVSALPMMQKTPTLTNYMGWSVKVYGKTVDCLFYIVKPTYNESKSEYLGVAQFRHAFSKTIESVKRFSSVFHNSIIISFYPSFGEDAERSDMKEEAVLESMGQILQSVPNNAVCLRENDDRENSSVSSPA